MTATATTDLITRYYAAFNTGDIDAMLACLTDDVHHHVNQAAFAAASSRSSGSVSTWRAAIARR